MSATLLDVRGLACPEPLIAFTEAAKKTDAAEMEIRFDCGAARDNLARAAASAGWRVASIAEAPDHTVMHLIKGA
ncbi:MAG: sulfurtransferase TusA family protein [Deltaproteobacteria bacterium]|jgi:TusA-related sulfurtransferase|nr:sulfurtransferase TusA family protein [Deltaproteobacteria bacterium]